MSRDHDAAMPHIDMYLKKLFQVNGSDLHLTSMQRPKVRIHGRLQPLDRGVLHPDTVLTLINDTMDERRQVTYRASHDVDYGYEVADVARFRVSAFVTRTGPAAVFRRIDDEIKTVPELGIPDVTLEFTKFDAGLVLVAGPTGCGKSTTVAALLDHVNRTQRQHIITIEDPIEYVHANQKSVFTQREIGADASSFASALRAATREDPDIILVGELRDTESIGMAVTAAEMGFLVFATLHANSAAKAVDRIVDGCPEEQQNEIRTKLATTLRGVCAQLLLPRRDRRGRVPVNEILMPTPGLENIIRDGNAAKIVSLIEAGRGRGMQLMDDAILQQYEQGVISAETATLYLTNKQRLPTAQKVA